MTWQFILAILLAVVGAIGWVICGVKDSDNIWVTLGGFFMSLSGVIWLLSLITDVKGKPKPIDVYRDKTTLQITYKIVDNDTIDIDSCVVWKPEFNPNTKNE
jgi:hypothetical protein